MGYEYVDAESPEWPPRPAPASRSPAGTFGADVGDPDALAAAVRQRIESDLARRRRRPLTAPWADAPLADARFVVIDLETTGAGADGDEEIVEIGAVQVNGLELGREFTTLVDPRRPISWTARAVHGIRDSEIWRAPRLEQALPWLLETVQDRVLVFHNAGFDLPFLQRALAEAGRRRFKQPVVDTLRLARRLAGGPCSLGALMQRFGIPPERPHRAAPDARATALLLIRFLALYGQAGATRLGDIAGIGVPRWRSRGRRRDRVDPLVERLERAIRRGESLRLWYHADAGLAPVELEILPLALIGAAHLHARQAGLGTEIRLALDRIGRLVPA